MHPPPAPIRNCSPPTDLNRYFTEVLRILVAAAERGALCPLVAHPPPAPKPN